MPVLTLPAEQTSPAIARGFVSSWLTAWGLEHLSDRVVLATSELVTNAVLHAKLPLELDLRADGSEVRLTVTDPLARTPHPRRAAPGAASGRGLAIVADLADRWGSDDLQEDGKAVWCSFSLLQAC